MKNTILILLFACVSCNLLAQGLQLPAGKKFSVTTVSNNIAEITTLDQHLQMINDGEITIDFEIKAVTNTGYTLQLIPRHFKTLVSIMGREQKMDTDSAADRNNPEMEKVIALLNKPQTIVVDSNKIISRSNLDGVNSIGNNIDDAGKYFLNIPSADIKNGYQWSDSSITGGTKITNKYTILNNSATQTEVNVISDLSINIKSLQGETELQQSFKGFSTGKRIYNRANRLLEEEQMSMDITGSAETKEISSPITMKINFKTKVQ